MVFERSASEELDESLRLGREKEGLREGVRMATCVTLAVGGGAVFLAAEAGYSMTNRFRRRFQDVRHRVSYSIEQLSYGLGYREPSPDFEQQIGLFVPDELGGGYVVQNQVQTVPVPEEQ